jgi:hypothetical protein
MKEILARIDAQMEAWKKSPAELFRPHLERTVEERFENGDSEFLAEPIEAAEVATDVPEEFKEAQVNWHPRPKLNGLHLHRLSVGQISLEVFMQMYPGETAESVAEALEAFRKMKG